MTKISKETYDRMCKEQDRFGGEFYLWMQDVEEWKKLGKFDVIKEFCDSRNYEIFFCCMKYDCSKAEGYNSKNAHLYDNRVFGFIFRSHGDVRKLFDLVQELERIDTKKGVKEVRVLGRRESDKFIYDSEDIEHPNESTCSFNI